MGIMTALGLLMGGIACEKTDKSVTTTETKTSGNGKTSEIKTKTETKAGGGKTTETKTIETKTTETTTTETKTSDTKAEIGVAECDDYVVKLTDCTKKMPGPTAVTTSTSLATLKKGWKDAASTPEGRVTVATACKNALVVARREYASLGCTF
jgi:hypothetical protein